MLTYNLHAIWSLVALKYPQIRNGSSTWGSLLEIYHEINKNITYIKVSMNRWKNIFVVESKI